ncbi:cellulose synthase complex periplasmic endoglucanase BcsZ [Herbaspirillum lusitanum]|jgi:endoglucanase|uniref:cellulase n=1 Tax=Herbaspirillum lusitanum TaxID=213312 RepID=A0ABW9AHI3_9BURK
MKSASALPRFSTTRFFTLTALALLAGAGSAMAAEPSGPEVGQPPPACAELDARVTAWPQWDRFKQGFLQADGRVIDYATEIQQTTSEGQSYAMFFALVANDPARFATLWAWSRANLGLGSDKLPAWQWGKRTDGSYGVVDANSAADSDLWIAYALVEAGRLWAKPEYDAAGMKLLEQIKQKEIVDLPKLGSMLLPGEVGFVLGPKQWRLNPSYLPLPLLRRMAAVDASGPWNAMASSTVQLIRQAAPHGYAPDWLLYDGARGALPDTEKPGVGSYDAIRVYLWAGVTANGDPLAQPLRQAVGGMGRYVAANQDKSGLPPEKVDTRSGAAEGKGPVGFSAGLLPYLKNSGQDSSFKSQQQLVQERWNQATQKPVHAADGSPTDGKGEFNYYNSVLTLFGLGWAQGRYRFDTDGKLLPAWVCN